MNFRTLALSTLFATTLAGIGTARAAAPASHQTLTCEELYQGRSFKVQLSPPRYIRTTEIDITSPGDELMRAFQEPGEEQLRVRDSALHLTLNPNSCTLDTQSRAHFLECNVVTDDKLGFSNLSTMHFTSDGTSRLGAAQSVAIGRTMRLVSVTVHADVQTRPGISGPEERVIAAITVNAAIGAQTRTLHLTKDLGEWTSRKDRSDNDRCVTTP